MRMARARIRHPLFPALSAIPASEASGVCAAIAGTFRELMQGYSAGARATRVVFATAGFTGPFLSDSERDRLWELFEVPAYLLILDPKGRVAAYECEAYEGLHLVDGSIVPSSLAGNSEESPCGCGRPGLRWILAASQMA